MRRSLPWLALSVLALAASGAEAQTYQRTLVPGRPFCVVWPGRDYLYRIDAAGSSRTPGDSELSAIEAAIASWRAVSDTCSDFTFTRGQDLVHPRVGYVKDSQDNENVLTFREVDCNDIVPPEDACIDEDTCANTYACWDHGAATIGLTTTTFSFRTGYILDADIELNASTNGRGFTFTTVDSPPCDGQVSSECVVTDIQNTLTHELGHVVGLDHVSVPGSTMEPTAPPGETHKRIIDAGSAQGFCDAYPRGLPPTQCGERPDLGRHFQAVSTGTGVGCGAAPGSLFPAAALLGALALGRRRERAGGRAGAAPRALRD
ncbi:myxosortase-dependent metalloprotease, MXAN_2677/MXAN_2678 family [Archangium sp.]|uniref:myxosortase-dependent metalloprotease, MXAN_2677/MXAN_2678 family n=1 Tax=Archangium sp. TaxID=1872627 RepID=UPI0038999F60